MSLPDIDDIEKSAGLDMITPVGTICGEPTASKIDTTSTIPGGMHPTIRLLQILLSAISPAYTYVERRTTVLQRVKVAWKGCIWRPEKSPEQHIKVRSCQYVLLSVLDKVY